jgi:AcrR family transcriptional regulator
MSDDEPARPGRKRSEESRLAILTAALELTSEVGYAGLTVDGIAARAGTGKQTIYRWWRSKADVLLDAAATKADLFVPIPDHGDFAKDLHAFLVSSFALANKEPLADTLRALMAQAQIDEEFRERFWDFFLHRRRDALLQIVDRAFQRDEDVPGSGALIADVVFGVIWYRLLTKRPFHELDAAEIVYLICRRNTQ